MNRILQRSLVLFTGIVLVALTGCSTALERTAATEDSCQGGVSDLSVISADESPTGPATACLADSSIASIQSSEQPKLPVTLTDAKDREVTIERLDRVLALDISGTLAATVYALGMGDALVGRDGSTMFAEVSELPIVTQSGHGLSAEPIIAVDPTLIITDGSLGPNSVLDQLAGMDIPVVYIDDDTRLDTVDDVTMQVATALGVPGRGKQLNEQLAQEITSATKNIATLAQASKTKPRVAFLYVRGSASIYYLFGAESGADTLIQALSAEDVATEMGWSGMRPVTAEAIIAAQPDVVLVMTKGLESVGGVDGLLTTIPALAQTPAGLNRRVIDMADAQILSYGPRTAAILTALGQALYAPSTLAGDGNVTGVGNTKNESSSVR